MKVASIVDYLQPLFTLAAGYPWYFGLLAIMTIDVVTGVLAAFVTKTLSSKIGWTGIARKVGTICLVALAAILDPLLGAEGFIAKWTVIGFVAVEGLSILENCGRMGIITPVVLKEALSELRDRSININSAHTDVNMPNGSVVGGRRVSDLPAPANSTIITPVQTPTVVNVNVTQPPES